MKVCKLALAIILIIVLEMFLFSSQGRSEFLVAEDGAVAIIHRIRKKYASRNEEIVADLLYDAGDKNAQELEVVVRRKAAEIATIMAALHGGDWRVQADHEEGFVHITRRLQCTRKSAARRG